MVKKIKIITENKLKTVLKNNQKSWLVLVGLILLATTFILLVLFFMNGRTIQYGKLEENEKMISLSCEVHGARYPFFRYDNAISKRTRVKVIFDNEDNINTIALSHTLYYNDENQIRQSETTNRSEIDIAFGQNNIETEALSPKYSKLKDGFQMSLYADRKRINRNSLKFFMLDSLEQYDNYSLTRVKSAYNSRGFACTED